VARILIRQMTPVDNRCFILDDFIFGKYKTPLFNCAKTTEG
jgi:hypothetical protein